MRRPLLTRRARPSVRTPGSILPDARRAATGRGPVRPRPDLDGRPLADVVDTVLRTATAETVSGTVGATGPDATVLVRPMRVDGGPGVLVILETDDGSGLFVPLPDSTAEVVEQVQSSL